MPKYACRDERYSLKVIPKGQTLQGCFCPECPSGPYKGPDCLKGRSHRALAYRRRVIYDRMKKES